MRRAFGWGFAALSDEAGMIQRVCRAFGHRRADPTLAPKRLDSYTDLIGALLDITALACFCSTQLTDTEQETDGLLDAVRRPKFDMERVRQLTSALSRSTPPEVTMAMLAEHHRKRMKSSGEGGEPGGLSSQPAATILRESVRSPRP